MKKKLSHFCIHVKDMDKAVSYYKDKLGFEVEHQTDEWSELKLNDKVNLALHRVSNPGSGIGFMVDKCEEATKELRGRGVEIVLDCDRREEDGVILTQFKDEDDNIIWMAERIK